MFLTLRANIEHRRRAVFLRSLVIGIWRAQFEYYPGLFINRLNQLFTMTLRVNLCIIQPMGYIHSQGFLDQARYVRYQFRRLGAEVSIAKNRLREDSVNIILGAHLGFDSSLKQRHICVFFNLEQLGEGGASVSQNYLNLLRSSAVIDYDERNLAAYGCKPGDVPVISFQSAPYLKSEPVLALEDRPIDILFFGSINERRRAIFSRIESCGWSISTFDHPVYGDERDQYIRQAKAVLNCHYYESSRFEQARAFHTLSLGTPVISERTKRTTPPLAFENAVTWVSDEHLEEFFRNEFMTPSWLEQAKSQLDIFANMDALPAWQIVHDYCLALTDVNSRRIPKPWFPRLMCIDSGSGEYYQLGWLNVDAEGKSFADVSLDFNEPLELPIRTRSAGGGRIGLAFDQLDMIRVRDDVTRARNPDALMRNLLQLLKPEGRLELIISIRVMSELVSNPERTITIRDLPSALSLDRFWILGSLDYRFEIAGYDLLDTSNSSCSADHASNVLLALKKTQTTVRERTTARMHLPDFGISHLLDEVTPSAM
jgi:hypothetical protein